MSIATLVGFLTAAAITTLTIVFSLQNAWAVIDWHAFFVVVGGTTAVTLICFPLEQIKTLLSVFMRRVLGKNRLDYNKIVEDLTKLSDAKKQGKKNFEEAINQVEHPFLKDSARVLFWMKMDVSQEELRKLLETRAQTHFKEYMSEAKIFRTMAKFPPAFGLIGTTIGMIALMQSLGGGEEARKMIGPSMAIALLATLYGLVLANCVLIPVAENLTKQTEEDQKVRYMIVEGIMMIQSDKPTLFVKESVKSYLLPSQRNDEEDNAA